MSEGLVQRPYLAAIVEFEHATFLMQGTKPTTSVFANVNARKVVFRLFPC